ncbi:unnamed protein product [Durusdinium trenchii]|uniref:Plastid lipid-associated protein/fibrillin conserved domain-containing protein n=1 Tax=Durusdinium trenchii TaxID=1381693 RepID=A0ABP0HEN4_9DINO
MLASARFGQWTPISSPMVGVQRRMQPCCRSTQIAMNWNQRAVPMVALAIVIPLKPKSFGNFRQVGLCCVSAEAEVKELEPEELVRQVVTGLSKACKSVEGKISGIRRQIRDPSEAELWRNRGNGLLQVTEAWYPGMTEVKVPDYSNLGDDGLPLCVEVELDPKKDFKQNAKLCFKQASKITKAIEKCAPLLKAQEEELKVWKATLAKVEGPQRDFDAEQVKQLYEELCAQRFIRRPKPKVPSEQVQQPEENKWRRKYGKDVDRFLSPNGLEVLAGRSASANERVSFELTLKDALWLPASQDCFVQGRFVCTIAQHKDNFLHSGIVVAPRLGVLHTGPTLTLERELGMVRFVESCCEHGSKSLQGYKFGLAGFDSP